MMSRQSWTSLEETPQPLWAAPASTLSSTEPLPSRSAPHLHGCKGLFCLRCRTCFSWTSLSSPAACPGLAEWQHSLLACLALLEDWSDIGFPPLLLFSMTFHTNQRLILLKSYSEENFEYGRAPLHTGRGIGSMASHVFAGFVSDPLVGLGLPGGYVVHLWLMWQFPFLAFIAVLCVGNVHTTSLKSEEPEGSRILRQ